ERLHANAAAVPEGLLPHLDADPVPQGGQPSVVDLEDEPGLRDQLVLRPERLGESVEVLLVLAVVPVGAIDLEAGRRGGGEKRVLAGIGGSEQLYLATDGVVAAVAHGARADPADPAGVDLVARRVEERSVLGGVAIEVGEGGTIGPAGDQGRLVAGGLDFEPLEAVVCE